METKNYLLKIKCHNCQNIFYARIPCGESLDDRPRTLKCIHCNVEEISYIYDEEISYTYDKKFYQFKKFTNLGKGKGK